MSQNYYSDEMETTDAHYKFDPIEKTTQREWTDDPADRSGTIDSPLGGTHYSVRGFVYTESYGPPIEKQVDGKAHACWEPRGVPIENATSRWRITGLPMYGQAPAFPADSSICSEITQTEEEIETAENPPDWLPDNFFWNAAWRFYKKYWTFNSVKASSEINAYAANSAAGFSDSVEPRTLLIRSNGQVTLISGNGTSISDATGQGYQSTAIDDSPPPGLPDFTEYDLKLTDDDDNERYTYYLYDDEIEMHHWSTNIGEADWAGEADDIYVRFYLSKGYKSRNGDDDWVRVGSEQIQRGNLNVGAIKHEWTTLDLHEYFDNGYLEHDHVYNIVVCIDREHDVDNGDGEVPEMHKSNNCSSEAVFIFKESPIPPAERQALIALYNSTNGPGWTNNTGWNTESDPGTWYGLNCANGHVTQLNLGQNAQIGTIPPEIGNLNKLERLDFRSIIVTPDEPIEPPAGYLSGSIPPELGNLINLNVLLIDYNQLSGSIPPELGNLINLSSLSLAGNQLSGSIPSELGNLINLSYLQLNWNQLSGSIPPELGNLINLNGLWLDNNQLSGRVPLLVAKLVTKVNFCDFSNNDPSLCIPSTKEYRAIGTNPIGGLNLSSACNPCNLNKDGSVDLTDAILGLQIVSGITPSQTVYKEEEINDDGRIGVEDVIYILQQIAGMQ